MSDLVRSNSIELGVVENIGAAVGISLITLPVPEKQSTSGMTAAILISGSRTMSILSISGGILTSANMGSKTIELFVVETLKYYAY